MSKVVGKKNLNICNGIIGDGSQIFDIINKTSYEVEGFSLEIRAISEKK